MDRVDALVIGAGVVGLAVARALAGAGHDTIVVEAQGAVGQGVSSRNSEVIHSGLYYPPGSLTARLCVRGRELLYALCESHGVSHQRCGKLVVANDPADEIALRTLAARAAANGVPVQALDPGQARVLEPALRCTAALFSPTTGIVDSHALMLALQGDLERQGGLVAVASAVDSVALDPTGRLHVVRLAEGSEIGTAVLERTDRAAWLPTPRDRRYRPTVCP